MEFSLFYPKPADGYSSIQEEYLVLQKLLRPFDYFPRFSHIAVPQFMAIKDSQETSELRIKYSKIHKLLINEYANGEFFDVTIGKFKKK